MEMVRVKSSGRRRRVGVRSPSLSGVLPSGVGGLGMARRSQSESPPVLKPGELWNCTGSVAVAHDLDTQIARGRGVV